MNKILTLLALIGAFCLLPVSTASAHGRCAPHGHGRCGVGHASFHGRCGVHGRFVGGPCFRRGPFVRAGVVCGGPYWGPYYGPYCGPRVVYRRPAVVVRF